MKPIRFREVKDVYALLDVLSAMNAAQMTEQLIAASNGETYLLRDINYISNDEANASDITFITKSGTRLTLAKVKKILKTKTVPDLIHNKPLADALQSIDPNRGRLLKLNLPRVEDPNGSLNPFPFVFPILTPLETSEETHTFSSWRDWLRDHDQEPTYPGTNRVIIENELVANIALEKLIWVNLLQSQKRKLQYLKMLERKDLRQSHEKLKNEIDKLEDLYQEYHLSLLTQKVNLERNLKELRGVKLKYDDLVKENPDVENKDSLEIKNLTTKYINDNQRRNSIQNKLLYACLISITCGFVISSLFGFLPALAFIFTTSIIYKYASTYNDKHVERNRRKMRELPEVEKYLKSKLRYERDAMRLEKVQESIKKLTVFAVVPSSEKVCAPQAEKIVSPTERSNENNDINGIELRPIQPEYRTIRLRR